MALADSYSKQSAADVPPALSKVAVKARAGNATLQYQRAQVETASPTRLIIMLYEGAIRFCQLALDGMAAKDLAVQHENLLKAQRILAELLGSLKRDQGGEVADNLARLYTHMLEQLVLANLHDQPEPVQRVQSMLRDLWASWIEVERLADHGTEPQEASGAEGAAASKQPSAANSSTPLARAPRLGNVNA